MRRATQRAPSRKMYNGVKGPSSALKKRPVWISRATFQREMGSSRSHAGMVGVVAFEVSVRAPLA